MLYQVVVEATHRTWARNGDYTLDHCGWPFPTLEEAMAHLLECKKVPQKEKSEDDDSGREDWYGDYGIIVIDDPAREVEIVKRRREFEAYSQTEEYKKHWGEPTES